MKSSDVSKIKTKRGPPTKTPNHGVYFKPTFERITGQPHTVPYEPDKQMREAIERALKYQPDFGGMK